MRACRPHSQFGWQPKIAQAVTVPLMTVFAVGAILASSASAIPKFKLPITKRRFTATSGTAILRTPAESDEVRCGSSTAAGTILGDDEVSLRIHYLSCFLQEGTNGPCPIKSVGAPGTEGLVLTLPLLGLLGLLHQPEGAAGILFEPSGVPNHVFVTFAPTSSPCNTATTALEGSIAGLFLPTDKLQRTALINLGPTSATGKQFITLDLNVSRRPQTETSGSRRSGRSNAGTDRYCDFRRSSRTRLGAVRCESIQRCL